MIPRISREQCALLIIDVQERYIPALHDAKPLVDNISILAQAAELLDIPAVVTEQYPQGIGPTIGEIQEVADFARTIEKSTFSCFGSEEFCSHMEELGKSQLLITGSETHVCVKKTALDALERGYDVFVIEDAVASRSQERKDIAIRGLMQAGAQVESAESAIFEFIGRSDGTEFKLLHRLIK